VSVCLSVLRRIPTLLHGAGYNFGNGKGAPYSCELLDRFAIGALVTLLDEQHTNIAPNAKRQRVLVLAQCLVYYISRESYIGDAKSIVVTRVCLSVCLSAAACLHYCTDPDVTWRSGRGCPLLVHYWAICNRSTGFVIVTI